MLQPGTQIGGLLIGDMLGRGAMGEVYRGVQLSLRRPVAVKRIAGHLLDDPDIVARFAREAQCVAKVQSQHVVAVYEFGTFPDSQGEQHCLLVMELVDGGMSVKKAIDGPMDWRLASSIVLQVADGLMAAGEHGVVHRDIKPDNIMLSRKGVAKLCDFGLARSVDSTAMTMEGSLLGTPNYMPPEACRGEHVEAPGDIYSLGATWYHLLCGQPPHTAANTMALLRAHIEDEPPAIASLAPDVPPAIAGLVMRCLSKDGSMRPSAEEVHNDLCALAAEGIMLPRTVAELVDGPGNDSGDDPSTMATLISQDKTLATALNRSVDSTAATLPMGQHQADDADATLPTVREEPAASVAERSAGGSKAPLIVGGLLVVVGGVGALLWSQGAFAAQPAPTPAQSDAPTTTGPAMPVIVTTSGDGQVDPDEPVDEPAAAAADAPALVAARASDDQPTATTPAANEPEPANPLSAPASADTATHEPVPAVTEPTDPPAVAQPVDPPEVAEPAEPADEPVEPAEPPAEPADEPVEPAAPPAEPADEPVEQAPPAPVEPPAVPVEPAPSPDVLVARCQTALDERRLGDATAALGLVADDARAPALQQRLEALRQQRTDCVAALAAAKEADDIGSLERQAAILATFPDDAELSAKIGALLRQTETSQLQALEQAATHQQAGDLLKAVSVLQELPAEDTAYTAAALERRTAVEGAVVTAANESIDTALLSFEGAMVKQDWKTARQHLLGVIDLSTALGRRAEIDAAAARLITAVQSQ